MPSSRLSDVLDIPPVIGRALGASFMKGVKFTRQYPNTPLVGPTIVWHIVRRVMGKEGKETRKPRIRGIEENGANELVMVYGQWTTATFQFDLFGQTEDGVDELMRRFELFVIETRPTLVECGVDQFIFEEQLRDHSLPTPKEIPSRSLRYSALMSTLYFAHVTRMRQIGIHVACAGHTAEHVATRGSGASDAVPVRHDRIAGIADESDAKSYNYVAGVDYDIAEGLENTATITWLDQGLAPQAGANYYVVYASMTGGINLRA